MPLPLGVVVMLDDGEVAGVDTETPVSQAESATGPPEPWRRVDVADDGDWRPSTGML